jgi:predicted transcriptional regulator
MSTLIDAQILQALKTYQWTPTATVYNFANSINYSEGYIHRHLTNLVAAGEIERVAEGMIHGKPRYIYKLINNQR